MLKNVGENSVEGWYMIDAMQRLNIDYHFQQEIDEFLATQYSIFSITYANGYGGHSLHELSLLFRLSRQQGHNFPSGGNLNLSIMLYLYKKVIKKRDQHKALIH